MRDLLYTVEDILVAIFICAFVRNRTTNILALALGLFFKINGTSERVLVLLSNLGLSISSSSIERLKLQISKDAVQLAIDLITGPSLFYIIFDNINLYLRKFQERITNRHSMIHATNVAVGSISEGDITKVEDLAASGFSFLGAVLVFGVEHAKAVPVRDLMAEQILARFGKAVVAPLNFAFGVSDRPDWRIEDIRVQNDGMSNRDVLLGKTADFVAGREGIRY